jgi:hypothetical protein
MVGYSGKENKSEVISVLTKHQNKLIYLISLSSYTLCVEKGCEITITD